MSNPLTSNPLLASELDISKPQSIVWAIVYAIFAAALLFRIIRGAGRRFVYIFLTLFATLRVITFAMRYKVANSSYTDSSYKTDTILAAVFLIAGFLFLVEAICELILNWYCTIRSIVLAEKTNLIIHLARHITFMAFSVIGVIGAVEEVDNAQDGKSITSYKDMREVSGGLFLAACIAFSIIVIVIAIIPPRRPTRKIPAMITLLLCTAGLIVESAYRIWSAASTSGFIVKQSALDVLIVLPELIILLLGVVMNMDDLGDVRFIGQRPHLPQSDPQFGMQYIPNKV